MEFSKRLISDIRGLLWVVTVGGLLLAAYCIRADYAGALPWLTAMVGLPWTTFEAARAAGFQGENSPSI